MTRMTPLLERNEQFARTYTPIALGPAAAKMVIVTCLDHRVDPAIVLGLQLGDAPVIRNAGGRVTQAATEDIAGGALQFHCGRRRSVARLLVSARDAGSAQTCRFSATGFLSAATRARMQNIWFWADSGSTRAATAHSPGQQLLSSRPSADL